MKCIACGYEKRNSTWNRPVIIRYKSGKRKGEIKEITEELIEPFKDDPKFKLIEIGKSGELDFHTQMKPESTRWYSAKAVNIYACPKCGTLRLDPWEL